MQFKVNDRVTWWSSSGGSRTEKTGNVVEIIPADNRPDAKRWGLDSPGYGRDHESYIVAVKIGKTDKAKPKHYWPRVSALEPAQQ
jgi:hypothetical protein